MISLEDIKKTAELAKLELEAEYMEKFVADLNNVMDMIDQLNEIDCSEIEPLRSVSELYQRMAKDKVSEGDICEQLFDNIPKNTVTDLARDVKCFVVPKVVE